MVINKSKREKFPLKIIQNLKEKIHYPKNKLKAIKFRGLDHYLGEIIIINKEKNKMIVMKFSSS